MLDVMFDADIADRADANPAPQPRAGIAFANLGPHQCRWPLETPQERGPWPRGTHAPPPREFRFCGLPTVFVAHHGCACSSYCRKHSGQAYWKAPAIFLPGLKWKR